MSENCSICDSTFSSKLRKPIECTFCKKCCCKECFSTFTKDLNAPKCMFCNTEVTMDFVEENTTKKFMKEYNVHLCDLRFSAERAKLAATQRLAELYREKENYDEECKEKRLLAKKMYYECKILRYELAGCENIQERKEKKEIINNTKNIISQLYIDLNNIYNMVTVNMTERRHHVNILTGVTNPVNDETETVTYSRPCFATDCRGFLSKSYKCGTCDKYFCADCHEHKNNRSEEHVCNEDAKATIAMIRRDSKPCPKCSIPIEKVSGCSQMWCVSCHTTFDWNTMRIETGYIHNPEYLRWMRLNNREIQRNPLDNARVVCDTMPDYWNVNGVLSSLGIDSREWDELHRRYHHIRAFMNGIPREDENDYVALRVDYLLSKISEEEWRKKLGMLVKKNKLGQERYNVYDLYCNGTKDLFINLVHNKDIIQFKDSMLHLEQYANEQLTKINKKYGSTDSWHRAISCS